MGDAYYDDDYDEDLANDDWGEETYSNDSVILDEESDDDAEYYDDDMEEMDDVDDLDYADGDTYDDEDDFMVGFADAAPELAESLREVLHERYADASPEEVEQALGNLVGAMSAAEGFNFGKILKSIGRGASKILRDPVVSQIAKTALPIAGGAAGTLIGGPVGTALGSQLGNLAGSAFGPPPRRRPTPVRRAPRRAVAPRPVMARPSPAGGSAAAAQLLQLTQNPNVLKSLLSLALGKQGRESVTVADGTTIPIGSFMNLLKTLSNEAATDADQLMRGSRNDDYGYDTAAYMKDEAGEYIVDPAVPEARAEALYETLMEVENEKFMSETEDNLGYDDDEEDSAERRRSRHAARRRARRRRARRRALARARARLRRARRYGYRRDEDDDAYEDDEYFDDEYDYDEVTRG